MITTYAFDRGGYEVALICLFGLWLVAALGYERQARGARRGDRLRRWRIALIGMPIWMAFVGLRLAIGA